MIPQPLHPAVVHFPIVFVVLFPIAAVAALVAIRRGAGAQRAWLPVVALALALSGSAWVAVQTGETDEEVAEEVVGEPAIHEHEEAAELFMAMSLAALLLTGAGLSTGRLGDFARPTAAIGALLLLMAGYRVGHSGGALVYEQGAAQAYVARSDARIVGTIDDDGDRSERERHD